MFLMAWQIIGPPLPFLNTSGHFAVLAEKNWLPAALSSVEKQMANLDSNEGERSDVSLHEKVFWRINDK